MVATHTVLGQAEKILRVTPNQCLLGQRKTLPMVKSLEYFQVRHSFYSLSIVMVINPALLSPYRHQAQST